MAVVAYVAATVLTTVRVLAAHDLESAVQDLHRAASGVLFFFGTCVQGAREGRRSRLCKTSSLGAACADDEEVVYLNEELGIVHLPKELLEHECPEQ